MVGTVVFIDWFPCSIMNRLLSWASSQAPWPRRHLNLIYHAYIATPLHRRTSSLTFNFPQNIGSWMVLFSLTELMQTISIFVHVSNSDSHLISPALLTSTLRKLSMGQLPFLKSFQLWIWLSPSLSPVYINLFPPKCMSIIQSPSMQMSFCFSQSCLRWGCWHSVTCLGILGELGLLMIIVVIAHLFMEGKKATHAS